jgi:glutathione S-transferase
MLLYVDANFASPYALVAFVSLIEKGLNFEIESVDLAAHANHDPKFARTSITRRIPTLIDNGFALSESSAICEYIDETYDGTRLYPTDRRDRARARQIQAWVRSDLMPIRDERPTFVVFNGVKRPALSQAARDAAEQLFSAALSLLGDRTDSLFGAWSIADVDLAMMLQRLIVLGDPVPQRLIDYAARQWRRPSVEQWVLKKRPPLVGY